MSEQNLTARSGRSKASTDRSRYAECRSEGICTSCRKRPAVGGQRNCAECKQRKSDQQKVRRASRINEGLCPDCGGASEYSGKCCSACRDGETGRRAVNRKHRQKIKDRVFGAYGGYRCACCGETEPAFLSIDHIHNDGEKHREIMRAGKFYRWLVESGFPDGFQVLCMNCNHAKGRLGECPHKTNQRQSCPVT